MIMKEKVDLVRYFENLSDEAKVQAFLMVCNGDIDFIVKQAVDFRKLYTFDFVGDDE